MKELNRSNTGIGFRGALLTAFIAIALSGCGPGFPIMTKAQEEQSAQVEDLRKQTDDLNKRVATLEGTGGASKDMEELRKKVAALSLDIESIRQDFSFVQGSIETDSHDKSQTKESFKSLNSSIAAVNAKLSTLDAALKESLKSITDLKTAVDANERLLQELRDDIDIMKAQSDGSTTEQSKTSDGKATTLKPKEHYSKGLAELKAKQYDNSLKTLKDFIASFPNDDLAGNAQYWIGEIYYAKGDFEQAALEFDKAVKKYPKSNKAAASLLKEGYSFEKLGMKEESKVVLEDLIEKHPKSQEAKKARSKLGKK